VPDGPAIEGALRILTGKPVRLPTCGALMSGILTHPRADDRKSTYLGAAVDRVLDPPHAPGVRP
jgi:hypothetical protein